MEEAFAAGLDETVVGVSTGWLVLRRVGHEGAALLEAGQDTGYAHGAMQATVVRLDQLFFAQPAWCGQHGDVLLISDPPYPRLVGIRALLKDRRLEAGDADDLPEEVHQVLWALQPLDVAGQDDAIPTGVDELDSSAQ